MFTSPAEMGKIIPTELRIHCVRSDKVTAITDMLQHEHNDLCLLGNALNSFESVFLVCEIKRIMHGNKYGSDVVITLKLF